LKGKLKVVLFRKLNLMTLPSSLVVGFSLDKEKPIAKNLGQVLLEH